MQLRRQALIDNLARLGRFFFAFSIAVFGIVYLFLGKFVSGLPPVPPWAPGGRLAAYATGVLLVLTGAGMMSKTKANISAMILGCFFLLCVIFLHTARIKAILLDGSVRTGAFEPLAFGAAALSMAGTLRSGTASALWLNINPRVLLTAARFLFAFSILVFGLQHFEFARFIAFLVPAWMPAHLFSAYFTGTAMVAAAISLAFNWRRHLALLGLGSMFLLWVLLLHLPRSLAQPQKRDEWISAVVCLAMSGASFALLGSFGRGSQRAVTTYAVREASL